MAKLFYTHKPHGDRAHVDLDNLADWAREKGIAWVSYVPCTGNAMIDFSDDSQAFASFGTIKDLDHWLLQAGYQTWQKVGDSLAYPKYPHGQIDYTAFVRG